MKNVFKQFYNIGLTTNQKAPAHIQKQIMEKAQAKRDRKKARCSLDGTHGWYGG